MVGDDTTIILLYLCRAVDAGTRVQPRSRLTRTLLVTENLTVTERPALRIDGMCALMRRRDKLSFRNPSATTPPDTRPTSTLAHRHVTRLAAYAISDTR